MDDEKRTKKLMMNGEKQELCIQISQNAHEQNHNILLDQNNLEQHKFIKQKERDTNTT